MTARELLEALRALPEVDLELGVRLEGCDCEGDLAKLEVRRTTLPRNQGDLVEVVLWRTKGPLQEEEQWAQEEAQNGKQQQE
jgi:hypothetical protein